MCWNQNWRNYTMVGKSYYHGWKICVETYTFYLFLKIRNLIMRIHRDTLWWTNVNNNKYTVPYAFMRKPSGHADQSSGRLQVDWKHEDVLKTSWCLLQGYVSIKWNILEPPWWRLQHVMFIRPQEDHPKTSPHDVCNWTGSMKMYWRRLDAFFRAMSLSNEIF